MVSYDVVAKTKRDRAEFVENYMGEGKNFQNVRGNFRASEPPSYRVVKGVT